MIKCPNCGGELQFSPEDKIVKCQYCSSEFDPKELSVEAKVATKREKIVDDKIKATVYGCSQCGAELLTFDETAITFCSYCGSQAMLEGKMIEINNPDYIIPFKVTKEQCIAAYKRKINKALFAPSYMKDDIVVEKFRGIYMPYCVYKASYHDIAVNKGKKYTHSKGNYDYYDNFDLSGQVDTDYQGISYDMVSKLFDKYTEALPYDFTKAEVFNPNYLIGFYADVRDVSNNIYDGMVNDIVKEDTTKKLAKNKTFARYSCLPKIEPVITERKIGMFPVYFLAIRDKNKNYVHYAVVNGQTGKVAMDIPFDFKKYIFGSLIIAALIFLVLNHGLILLPKGIILFSIVFLVISFIISTAQLDKISLVEKHYDDLGYTATNNISKAQQKMAKMPFKEKVKKYLFKQLIGIALAILVFMINPVSDTYYYGVAIINFLLAIWSFYDIVKERNLLVSSKLPQLEQRGGDEE